MHKGDIAQVHCCIKRTLGTNGLTKGIFEDINPGILRKLEPKKMKKILHQISRKPGVKNMLEYMGHFKSVFFYYLDLIKDIAILKTMVLAVGSGYILTHYEDLQSQIIVGFFCTVFLPILMNGCDFLIHPYEALGIEEKRYTKCQKIVIRVFVLLLSLLLPAILLYRKRRCRAKIDKGDENCLLIGKKIYDNKKTISDLEGQNVNFGDWVNLPGEIDNMQLQIEENAKKIEDLKKENETHHQDIDATVTKQQEMEQENKKLRELIIKCKMTESALENMFQTVLQLTLLLMNETGKNLCFKLSRLNSMIIKIQFYLFKSIFSRFWIY
jgi:hypothetical protein